MYSFKTSPSFIITSHTRSSSTIPSNKFTLWRQSPPQIKHVVPEIGAVLVFAAPALAIWPLIYSLAPGHLRQVTATWIQPCSAVAAAYTTHSLLPSVNKTYYVLPTHMVVLLCLAEYTVSMIRPSIFSCNQKTATHLQVHQMKYQRHVSAWLISYIIIYITEPVLVYISSGYSRHTLCKNFIAHGLKRIICWVIMVHAIVINWKYIPCYWPFMRGIHQSLADSPHKGQRHRVLMFSLTSAWACCIANNRGAREFRRHRAYYDVTVMRWMLVGMNII